MKSFDKYTQLNTLCAMTKYIIDRKNPYFYLIILQKTSYSALCLNKLSCLLQKKLWEHIVVTMDVLFHSCLFVHMYLSLKLYLTGLNYCAVTLNKSRGKVYKVLLVHLLSSAWNKLINCSRITYRKTCVNIY